MSFFSLPPPSQVIVLETPPTEHSLPEGVPEEFRYSGYIKATGPGEPETRHDSRPCCLVHVSWGHTEPLGLGLQIRIAVRVLGQEPASSLEALQFHGSFFVSCLASPLGKAVSRLWITYCAKPKGKTAAFLSDS